MTPPTDLTNRLREPHYMPDADYAQAPESIAETVKLMRLEREEAATLIETQAARIERLEAALGAQDLAKRIRAKDAYLVDYLLGWCGIGPEQPWGAAMSFALEMAAGMRLIQGESDATPTELGRAVAAALSQSDQRAGEVERAAIVEWMCSGKVRAWIKPDAAQLLVDAIERGEHIPTTDSAGEG